jgi:hypothetical protein
MTEKGRIVGPLHLIDLYEGIAYVNHISSGSIVCGPVSSVRVPTDEERADVWHHVKLAETLHESERQVAEVLASTSNDRRVQGLISRAKARGLTVVEAGGFYKVFVEKGESVYISKNCRRLDLSGFSIYHALVRQISESEASVRRLGRVCAQAIDIPDEHLDQLWDECIDALCAK